MPFSTDASDSRSVVYTVDEICGGLKDLIDELEPVSVQGEVQSLSTSARGHKYFELAGEKAILKVKMWANVARSATFERGDSVVIKGAFDFYPPRGELSLTAHSLTLSGEGAILARIEAVRRRLEADGLFAIERKRELPFLPSAIGVICGTDAAVRRDIEAARETRFPGYPIVWRESLVSGSGAVDQLVSALADLDDDQRVEVIVLARGGGSFDDLLPFSDERLCRAIAATKTPVVSAIGHEADVPLSDLVADLRCSTPTRAGLEVIPDKDELLEATDLALDAIDRALMSRFDIAGSKINAAALQLAAYSPARVIASLRDRLTHLDPQVLMQSLITTRSAACKSLENQLAALGPSSVLARGYGVVRGATGEIITTPEQAPAGALLEIALAGGSLAATSNGTAP